MWDLGLLGVPLGVPFGVFLRDSGLYLCRFFGENHRKLRIARSTSATRDWTRHLPSTYSEGRTIRSLRGLRYKGNIFFSFVVILLFTTFEFYDGITLICYFKLPRKSFSENYKNELKNKFLKSNNIFMSKNNYYITSRSYSIWISIHYTFCVIRVVRK